MNTTQTILITGTSTGFGHLSAQTLLQEGYTVFATMRDLGGKNAPRAEALNTFARDQKGRLHLLDLDVTDPASVNTAVNRALEFEGRIDVVVNNAGYGAGGFGEAVTIDQFQHQFDVNVFGIQRVNRAVLPSMRKNGTGLLIHISSIMGRIVIPFAAAYTASKFALEGLCESYRYELAGTGVDVAIVEPGGFGTDFLANMVTPDDAERIAGYGPVGALAEKMWSGLSTSLSGNDAPDPQEVADAVLGLIRTPAGRRPLRTVVDPLTGGGAAKTVNQTADQVQTQLLQAFGLEELLTVKGNE